MRTSRKKLLRLDEKTCYCDDADCGEKDDDYRSDYRRKPRYKQSSKEGFKCKHCRRFVCPPYSGGRHRNHCPFCLYSLHVDDRKPGDRMSTCGCRMEPIGRFQRPNEESVIIHRCMGCDFERFNRIAADDDFDLVLALPALPPRTRREVKAQQLEALLAEEQVQWEWAEEAS
jgi:RNHCP domain-containing protein